MKNPKSLKKLTYLLITIGIVCYSCGGNKNSTPSYSATGKSASRTPKKIKRIVDYALTFDGTRYKYGGTTSKGMDCSGLVYTSFKKENIVLPRTSKAMSTQGKKRAISKATVGDLLFFKTNKNKNTINHVGIVVSTKGTIKFIHASVSKGVTVSSLSENYWKNCFSEIRRVL